MSSINPHYTFEYSQPEAYRFSHDSVFLARKVFEQLRGEIQSNWRMLDLCAGCGIVGMDFLFHCQKELGKSPRDCDFLELQSEYEPHFQINRERLKLPETEMRFLNQNYATPWEQRYDLILSNPPYFEPTAGKLSPNEFKNKCRFFIDADREQLFEAIAQSLKPQGRAFVLSRSECPSPNSRLKITDLGDIRGTRLWLCSLR